MAIKLTLLQSQKIKDAALRRYPNEMCGVLTAEDFIELDNYAIDPSKSFSFDPVQYGRVVEQVVAIVHSHTKSINDPEHYDLRTPSRKDRLNQRTTNKVWLIVGTEGHEVSEPIQFPREPSSQYLNRPFMWFVNDCYTLVQDWYRFERGIELMDHADDFDPANMQIFSGIFEPYIAQAGFVEVTSGQPKFGDLLLLSAMGMLNNHLGIYDDGRVIHQLGLSVAEPYEAFLGKIHKVLRYRAG